MRLGGESSSRAGGRSCVRVHVSVRCTCTRVWGCVGGKRAVSPWLMCVYKERKREATSYL